MVLAEPIVAPARHEHQITAFGSPFFSRQLEATLLTPEFPPRLPLFLWREQARHSPSSRSRQEVSSHDETIIQGSGSAACDILINISLCWVFDAHSSGNKRTDSFIDRLMFYAINRGIETSVCALFGGFLYNFVSGTYYFLITLLANTHLYVISTISILTLRGVPADSQKDQPIHLSDLYLTTMVGADAGNGKSPRRTDSLEIKV
ncbi:hypothetical protein M422DRAFT_262207 [Sphaerobolus stellatus SS14]|uniref:DUF6534 domain-containing protein n=1 Tax=Sphaerobolus stellatus (strain SS14) TaxID=990650 RepID=A0A0C9VDW1_SPHS4|nr:hypothetical protein M422DRAFT_262207 [Sphaerobolus stellatus SS14]